MPGFSKGDGLLHLLLGTDLADQNNVRCLAQGVFKGVIIAVGVHAHLTLVDDGHFMLVHKFHRIFDGNDVPGTIAVAVVNQRRQRCGLARPGATHEQDQAALLHDQFGQDFRQT